MTNQEKFIQIFGNDAWQQMIVFSGAYEQFKEYWEDRYVMSNSKEWALAEMKKAHSEHMQI